MQRKQTHKQWRCAHMLIFPKCHFNESQQIQESHRRHITSQVPHKPNWIHSVSRNESGEIWLNQWIKTDGSTLVLNGRPVLSCVLPCPVCVFLKMFGHIFSLSVSCLPGLHFWASYDWTLDLYFHTFNSAFFCVYLLVSTFILYVWFTILGHHIAFESSLQ